MHQIGKIFKAYRKWFRSKFYLPHHYRMRIYNDTINDNIQEISLCDS